MRNLLKENQLSHLNIRLEDSFTIMAYLDGPKWVIFMISVSYLHPNQKISEFQKPYILVKEFQNKRIITDAAGK